MLVLEFIEHIENNIDKSDKIIQQSIRNRPTNIINEICKNHAKLNSIDSTLITYLNTTKQFIKDHSQILFTRADKGNITGYK